MRKGLRRFDPYHWVVEVLGHKLETHHPVVEPVSPLSRERKFATAYHPPEITPETRGSAKAPIPAQRLVSSRMKLRTRPGERRVTAFDAPKRLGERRNRFGGVARIQTDEVSRSSNRNAIILQAHQPRRSRIWESNCAREIA